MATPPMPPSRLGQRWWRSGAALPAKRCLPCRVGRLRASRHGRSRGSGATCLSPRSPVGSRRPCIGAGTRAWR
eukprot:3849536-Alexandrium_andersonii.AAC.1